MQVAFGGGGGGGGMYMWYPSVSLKKTRALELVSL